MDDDPRRLAELSGLLDEALDLAPEQREAWLQGLSGPRAAFSGRLRVLLVHGASVETHDFLKPPDFAALLRHSPPGEPATPDFTPGLQVGAYRLLRELGQGGMGHVWLAERNDGRFTRQVALKFPYAGLQRRQLAERLSRERDILARLEHPNIARLYDADVSALDQPFLVLEFVDGLPIGEYCDAERLPVRERLLLFVQVLGAVGYAHAHLVIHRDLKPSNILITRDRVARLLDFGIAKLLSAGETRETALTQLAGRALTPDYASPEQISGRPLTTASDVYSLGVVLYELLTGARPYRLKRESRATLEEAIAEADVIAPGRARIDADMAARRATSVRALARELRGDLDAIVLKALQKDPAARYASVDALAQDLQRWLAGQVVEARAPGTGYRLRKLIGRNRVAFGAGAAVFVALLAGAAVAGWQARDALAQAARLQATKSFLMDVFNANSTEQDDPLKAQQTTARELLDRAAARLDSGPQPSAEEREEILSVLGSLYHDLGLNERSSALRARRAALLKQMYGADDLRYAEALVEYAKNVYDTDDWKKAGEPLLEAERILDAHHDSSSATRGQQLNAMTEYLRGIDRTRARAYAERAIALERRYFPDGTTLVEDLRMAALIESETNHQDRARVLLEEALALQEKADRHEVHLIQPLIELAELQGADPGSAAAEANFRRGLGIAQRIYGEAAVDTIQSRLRYGEFLRGAGRLRESEAVLEVAERNASQLLGEKEAFHLPTVRDKLAQTEYELGNYALSAELSRKALAVREQARGGNRQHARMLSTYARLLVDMGHPDLSEGLMARALEGYTRSEVPVETTDAPLILSVTYAAQGRPSDAMQALARYSGQRHPQRAETRALVEVQRAAVYASLGERQRAEDILRGQLDALNAARPAESLRLLQAQIQVRLGRLLMQRAAAGEARGLLEAALQTRSDDLSAHSPLLADSQLALAECLLILRDDLPRVRTLLSRAEQVQAFNAELDEEFREPLRRVRAQLATNRPAR